MKKLVLVGALLALSVTAFACSNSSEEVKAETSLKDDFIQISQGAIDTYQHKETGCYYAYTRVSQGVALEQMYIEKWQKSIPYCEDTKR